MNRIKALSRYQKAVLLFILAMVAVFTVLYPLTCSRVGFLYHDAILLPDQQNGGTVYAGEIQGEDARFTVSADKTVTFQYGSQTYGPYTAREDPAAIPQDHAMNGSMTGVVLSCGEEVLFRGGVLEQGDYLLLELYLVSPEEEAHQLATRQLRVYADGVPLEQGDQVYSEWIPYPESVCQGQAWVSLVGLDCGPELAWKEEGYQARVHMPFLYKLPEEPVKELTYELLDLEGGGSRTGCLTLTPAAAQAAQSDSRTFAEGTVTALVSEDGRQLSVYAHQEETEDGLLLTGATLFHHQVTFIGASGKRYPDAGEGFRSYTSGHVNVQLAAAPDWVEEPIVAVEIGAIQLVYEHDTWWDGLGGGMVRAQDTATYEGLNWVISLD